MRQWTWSIHGHAQILALIYLLEGPLQQQNRQILLESRKKKVNIKYSDMQEGFAVRAGNRYLKFVCLMLLLDSRHPIEGFAFFARLKVKKDGHKV